MPASHQQSEAMRRHERRLEALKQKTLQRYPCVSATEFSELCHGEPRLDDTDVMAWWRQGRLIGVRTDSGRHFPVFQIDRRAGRLHEEVARVLAYFDSEEIRSGWPPYLWFTTPRPGIDDRIPAQCLADNPGLALEAIKFEKAARRG